MKTSTIAFIDSEISLGTEKTLDLGAILDNGATFHEKSLPNFIKFIEKADFICGHNILNHDLKYIKINNKQFIDTLFWSPLLFPKRPYHKLLKDDKLLKDELNNPVSDAIKTKDLLNEELAAFENLSKDLKSIFYYLLHGKPEFEGLFKYLEIKDEISEDIIIQKISDLEICRNASLSEFIKECPIELAYSLALINTDDFYSITPPWILKNFPKTQTVMKKLRNTPCKEMCEYCLQKLDVKTGLKHFFGFDNFRNYANEPLQEKAADLAIKGKSILVLFPTGGGKSIAFQLPALMSGENEKGLTVVISPLQSLMKDQVDNLERDGKTSAVTINGLLDPIERADVIKRVSEGSAHLLYIAPESLRSNTIEKLLLQRNIVRFVIDEAHCFSAWGQDFRPDYLYIADFIKKLQKAKNCENIPVSCFTATAKQNVIEDICAYFNEKLNIDLEIIKAKSSRENLTYKIIEGEAENKYTALRNIIKDKECPSIVYVSRTKTAEELAARLCKDEFNAKVFHGKLDKDIKIQNQNKFMQGSVQIMVATSAFGMGVDKKDVGLVVHYDISDSLENYLQEAGRAGRDENINADCYVLFDESDLDKHFLMLNQTKLNREEINQIWRAIKSFTNSRRKLQKSALEIARSAGWDDSSDNTGTLETRVISAVNALEQSGYVKRENNSPKVFADSIMVKTMQEVSQKIDKSRKFTNDKQKETAKRIMSSLFTSKSMQKTKKNADERIDYIADILGLKIEDVIETVTVLRDEKILDDAKDIVVFVDDKKAEKTLNEFVKLEKFLINQINRQEKVLHIKELNEQAKSSVVKIKTLLNFLTISNLIKRHVSGNRISISAVKDKHDLEKDLNNRFSISSFILRFLDTIKKDDVANFSVLELRNAFNAKNSISQTKASISDMENALLYLSKTGALNIEGGFLVVYNRLTIERLEYDNRKKYTEEDYKDLRKFYENKTMQIHIVGEYAKKMLNSEQEALAFVKDYFDLNYSVFLNQYFKGQAKDLKRNISSGKYKQLFDDLSGVQREIIDNKDANCIVVTAGPGSGKTRTLVHKLAALLIMEDVKPEQLLMLTFSRAAATEFKERLVELIGKTAHFVDIKTFHSYCFDLLGRKGNLENENIMKNIINEAVEKINSGEIEQNRITKTCLVIDEAQDMGKESFELVEILREKNEEMRIIAVGDDDQSIYGWNNSCSEYFVNLLKRENCVKYELLENYRSKANIVNFANDFVKNVNERMKSSPIQAMQNDDGEIKLVECKSEHPTWSLVEDVIDTPLSGSTCVLARSNQDVWKIAGMLASKRAVKIIQSNDGFNLLDILEIRYFYDNLGDSAVILENIWESAKRKLKDKFKNTNGLEIAEKVIRKFEQINQQIKYKSDFEVFAMESNLENFLGEYSADTIFVSTMHGAKGKEFDNVFIMLNQFYANTDEKKRLLYVAMTRAKKLLHIHFYGSNNFEIAAELNAMIYPQVNRVPMYLTHRDVHLGYGKDKQKEIEKLTGDENLKIGNLFAFSEKFKEKTKDLKSKGYEIKEIKINLIVHWKGKDMNEEIKVILPYVIFERPHAPLSASK